MVGCRANRWMQFIESLGVDTVSAFRAPRRRQLAVHARPPDKQSGEQSIVRRLDRWADDLVKQADEMDPHERLAFVINAVQLRATT